MASVDDIFKNSGVPSKRKLEAIKHPNEIYKVSKLSVEDAGRGAHVRAQPGDDQDFGPAMPPDDEDEAGDDEEGRFFGGGISKQESQILDFVDEAGDAARAPDKVDATWLRKTVLNFEKHITKNAELRAKHAGDPQKFISSEADLDADIKSLSILSEHPELYPDFVKLGSVNSLVGLLAHENTDIAIDSIEIIGELTDEDVSAEDDQWNALVDALIEADLVGLLVSNFSRLDEDDEADRNGVYYALGVIENLCSRTATATRICQEDSLPEWLLRRAQRQEPVVTQNKQYAAEILAILAQASPENCLQLSKLDTIDNLLQLVAAYRRRDPDKGGEEEEFMENLFEALTCLVDQPSGKTKFLAAEGVELCLIMLKDGKMSKAPALRLLDHAAGGATGAEVCLKIVEAGGLKGVFTLFNKTKDHRLLAHLMSMFASMLRLLPASSAERIRTLAKFVEKDYEKTAKMVRLHREYLLRVRRAEDGFARQDATDEEEAEIALLSHRLDAGLHTLQQIDAVLAWLVAEDAGASRKIRQLLAEQDEDFPVLAGILSEQQRGLDTSAEDSKDLSDMLGTLIQFLQIQNANAPGPVV
ncbi:DUF1716 domain-containing protein [Metarhizium album ARSEF 1941]|uniref:DUF1716 domain-containing protein n=1 Tax=Metarhizium album (strain ARSEF 1941) TaxID=1081103 RepID=A0A0B2WZ02_METAS|nr:DUF1716 domain-containing protein [Metarhizium album ARSEF 1941]KHN98667.1 DUF1716 domain-containing protein [Metarhizium album ARSEF 1941]